MVIVQLIKLLHVDVDIVTRINIVLAQILE